MTDVKSTPQYGTIREEYPRIADTIDLHWGYESFAPVMMKLMQDTRNGTRAGFPSHVGSAIIKLITMHAEYFPEQHGALPIIRDDPWSNNHHA